ncbi:hypothetical protein [Microvirga zambiensis]|uniref:hypothetical protein n=1 Tax=Microvirga zambiensis TaxID=1402137 RepID=UPI00191F6926|nr:hypothetical protein [Microvirga zambiensis]
MAKAETTNELLLVDEGGIARRELPFMVRLSGLVASMIVLAGAIAWALTTY